MTDRYFSPDSLFWRVNREALMVLSGPRALLLEMAHPLVAAGVAEHSDFRGQPLRRLFRTVGVMVALNFEPARQAQAAVAHTRGCHGPVHGRLAEDIGPYLAGTPYTANDPLLQLWVVATLLDSTVAMYEHLVRPLTLPEKAAYYAGGQQLARAFGVPTELMPPEYEDFQTYMDAMIRSDALTVGAAARAIVSAVMSPPFLGPAVRLSSFVSLGLTPPRLREAFGFRWTDADERRLERIGRLSRGLRPWVPAPLVIHPQALLAEWRLRRSEN